MKIHMVIDQKNRLYRQSQLPEKRCWRYNWLLEFDIKGLFDNIEHDLLMKAVKHHTRNKWILLYIERWLKAPFQQNDGTQLERTKGTPQGGVISPVLANLFLHYVFDKWMERNYPQHPFCRYADDGITHCRTEAEAKLLLKSLDVRFKECGLELHPEKTKIVYCKDDDRRGEYSDISFDFLSYTFRPRRSKNRWGALPISPKFDILIDFSKYCFKYDSKKGGDFQVSTNCLQ